MSDEQQTVARVRAEQSRVSDQGEGSVSLSWYTPPVGGAEVIGYRIEREGLYRGQAHNSLKTYVDEPEASNE